MGRPQSSWCHHCKEGQLLSPSPMLHHGAMLSLSAPIFSFPHASIPIHILFLGSLEMR